LSLILIQIVALHALVDTINLNIGTYIPYANDSMFGGAAYASYLNVDFLGGQSYTSVVATAVVISPSQSSYNHDSAILLGEISSSSTPVPLGSGSAPLPALGGTAMGLLALAGCALRGMIRRRPRAV